MHPFDVLLTNIAFITAWSKIFLRFKSVLGTHVLKLWHLPLLVVMAYVFVIKI